METIFNNTQTAFSLKSNADLKRAYFLFKMIAYPFLVKVGSSLAKLAFWLHLPVEFLVRKTVFNHFCGGINEMDSLKVVDLIYSKGVATVLDFSVEGKESETHFDAAMQMTIKLIEFAQKNNAIAFAVFKPSGFGRFELFQKIGAGEVLSSNEQIEWSSVEARYDLVCGKAFDSNVKLLIDAEESWIQNAADVLAEKMMEKYNTSKALIFNTLQMYRKDRLQYLYDLDKKATAKNFKIGLKLVRGAYMEKEADRAIEMHYPSPICDSKSDTDENFDSAVVYCLENLDKISVFVGTHNEASSYRLMYLMKIKNIENQDIRIWFGQLYGMSDTISYNLAVNKYNVAKYVPFGPVREVMPYLIRRAQENTSVNGQYSRELQMIEKEMKRRKHDGNFTIY
jgi:proline dehydrogenase